VVAGWRAVLEAGNDGSSFKAVAEFPADGLPQYTVTFAPVTARHFRLSFISTAPVPSKFATAPGAIVNRSPGAALRQASDAVRITELRILDAALVHRFEQKAGFEIVPDYFAIETPDTARVEAVPVTNVVNLTARVGADSVLDWQAPQGRWKVLRLGYSLIGKENHPATAEATGLEVDKLDRAAVERYINTYLGMYADTVGATLMGTHGVRALLNDSIEVGAQNWTPGLLREFASRRGYDPIPWLPALTGVIVESAAKSDAFLYDFRRTLADLITENHYAQITRSAHARGLIHYSEALEGWRRTLGDDLDMRRHADVPTAAMYSFPRGGSPVPALVGDMRGAASVAHIYGQNVAAAESLTSANAPWAFSPRDLQPMIDVEFAYGINCPIIHTSVHQPLLDKKPGLSLAVYGQYFNRNDTWAEQAGPWVSYISRSAYLLQQGRFVADVLYFYGEESPPVGLCSSECPKDTPTSYAYDFANADVILNHLNVADGELVTPSGIRYRMLYLGGSSQRMTLNVLRRLRSLVEAGATLVGEPPVASPSLADDFQEFRRLVQDLWPSGIRRGKGRVLRTRDVEAALGSVGVLPDFSFTKPAADSELLFLHRRLDDGEIYFVTNRRDRAEHVTTRFRVKGKQAEWWNAQSGETEAPLVSHRRREHGSTAGFRSAGEQVHRVPSERQRAVARHIAAPDDAARLVERWVDCTVRGGPRCLPGSEARLARRLERKPESGYPLFLRDRHLPANAGNPAALARAERSGLVGSGHGPRACGSHRKRPTGDDAVARTLSRKCSCCAQAWQERDRDPRDESLGESAHRRFAAVCCYQDRLYHGPYLLARSAASPIRIGGAGNVAGQQPAWAMTEIGCL
jgi:hypothetical protein